MINKTVAIFGVFDGIHEGHSSFIKEAKKQGNHLVVIVARDEVVKRLKGKLPKYSEVERINSLLEVGDVDLVLLGDPEIETYNTLKEVKPDIVYVGYDQKALFENLNKVMKIGNLPKMEIICGEPHKPELFHSSILNKS
ncbi:MAG: adenylyltransferase/cytidyltransferase family protein [Candidatus Paceibacterota bacterium]